MSSRSRAYAKMQASCDALLSRLAKSRDKLPDEVRLKVSALTQETRVALAKAEALEELEADLKRTRQRADYPSPPGSQQAAENLVNYIEDAYQFPRIYEVLRARGTNLLGCDLWGLVSQLTPEEPLDDESQLPAAGLFAGESFVRHAGGTATSAHALVHRLARETVERILLAAHEVAPSTSDLARVPKDQLRLTWTAKIPRGGLEALRRLLKEGPARLASDVMHRLDLPPLDVDDLLPRLDFEAERACARARFPCLPSTGSEAGDDLLRCYKPLTAAGFALEGAFRPPPAIPPAFAAAYSSVAGVLLLAKLAYTAACFGNETAEFARRVAAELRRARAAYAPCETALGLAAKGGCAFTLALGWAQVLARCLKRGPRELCSSPVPSPDVPRLLRRLRRQVAAAGRATPPALRAPAEQAKADGTIDGNYVWLNGWKRHLPEGLRVLLSFLLLNNGSSEEAAIRHCGFSGSSHLHKRLKDLRRRLHQLLGGSSNHLQIKTKHNHIYCEWKERK
jgi:hypothetical protein